jgi:hypothetical protein
LNTENNNNNNKVKIGTKDIAMLSELEQQAFVIGDIMKSIDEMYSARIQTRDSGDDDGDGDSKKSWTNRRQDLTAE